jgi:antitoxin component HigA of HigAB toxin-antitoxin module
MDLQTLTKIETKEQYDAVRNRVDKLIREATEKGVLEPDADNEYIREIGRLGILGARYEKEYVQYKHLKIREKSPLIREIEDTMYAKDLKQKDIAKLIGINEPSLSQIMRGKKPISMRVAKRLYHSLHIDPKLIMEYA